MEDQITGEYKNHIISTPLDCDILISHQPPFGILDSANNINYGSKLLLETSQRIKPTYPLFGHIHYAYGIAYIDDTTFVNASLMDESYNLKNMPKLLEINR